MISDAVYETVLAERDAAREALAAAEARLEVVQTERDHLYDQEWPWEWVIATREKQRREAAEAEIASLKEEFSTRIFHYDERVAELVGERDRLREALTEIADPERHSQRRAVIARAALGEKA